MIRIDHVTFSYGEENENAGGVHDINLTVEDGQCVVLCGESGCGKTTITRLINGLIPHYYEGKMNGEVWVNGAKVSEQPLYDTAKTVGSVFQNPRSQFFNVDTTSEITFGCENLGQPEQSIRERLDKTIRDFRLEKLMGRNIFHLSGGEKQKIACAGVSIMEPDVLVMDEPSSNLDASSILDLRAILAFWKSQGKTIIVSEHRLYYLRGLADRFIYITGGKVEKDYSVAEFESLTEQQRAKLGLRTFILEDLLPPKALPQAGQQMELHNFCFAYKNEPETLHIRESKIPANRIVGIIGNNGAGKSTFSRCFCGLEKRCGEVIWNGRTYRPKDRLNTCYMVMQEVNHQLFTETVLDEVLISMEEENQEWAEEILAELDLIGFKDRHPMSLSGGQKQRVAIASAIASKRSILFFDEPTSGLDYKHMKEVANVLKQVRDAGITLYVITHDLELLLDCCTDIVHTGISLRSVSFSYDGTTEVLHDVNLAIHPGTMTALVGPSGSGKSTVAKLIAGYWDVTSGSITLGGHELKDIPLSEIADQISYVSQDNYLFNRSIRENIRMGRPGATDAEVEQAAKQSGCDAFIRKLDNGYDTVVGSAGSHLSGGERQRIAIARAMLKNAPVVILDEATAYIDPENEALVQKAISTLTVGKTLIVIAHRLSTIVGADNIVVVKDGTIHAQGTHEKLLETCPLYRDMWQAHIGAKDQM